MLDWPAASCTVTKGKEEELGWVLVSVEFWWKERVDNPISIYVLKEDLRNPVFCERESKKYLSLGLGKWASRRHLGEVQGAFIYP